MVQCTAYTEQLEHYFTANDIDGAEKKQAILLSICGPTGLIRSLVSPKKATDYTFTKLFPVQTSAERCILALGRCAEGSTSQGEEVAAESKSAHTF